MSIHVYNIPLVVGLSLYWGGPFLDEPHFLILFVHIYLNFVSFLILRIQILHIATVRRNATNTVL